MAKKNGGASGEFKACACTTKDYRSVKLTVDGKETEAAACNHCGTLRLPVVAAASEKEEE